MIRGPVALAIVLATLNGHAQGIKGVTRRTTAQELQAPARQFFDAAGISVTGAGPASSTANSAVVVSAVNPPASGVAHPGAVPMLANKGATGPAQARPYVLGAATPARKAEIPSRTPQAPVAAKASPFVSAKPPSQPRPKLPAATPATPP